MVKNKEVRALAILLALLMLLPLFVAAFANVESQTAVITERRHPDKTGDEALLYDYLVGNLMHLTECVDSFNFLYDGMPVTFPPSDVAYRPEQIAVLMLGVIPRTWEEVAHSRPLPTEAVGYVHEVGFFRRIWNSLTGIDPLQALPQSGHIINHGYVTAGAFGTTGGRYSITIDGVQIPAFCNNRNIPGPATGASHRILELDNYHVLRALYFGWGGPANIFGPNQMAEGVLATTVVNSHLSVGTANPAEHNLQGSRDLWARVLDVENHPIRHNVQGMFIEVLAASTQNLIAIRVIEEEPIPDPVHGYLQLEKTAETNNVAGIEFRISGNGINQVVQTGANGRTPVVRLPIGTYTVTEINVGEQYIRPPAQTVTITAGHTETVPATLHFHNRLRPQTPPPPPPPPPIEGEIEIIKTSVRSHNGLQFRVTDTVTGQSSMHIMGQSGGAESAFGQSILVQGLVVDRLYRVEEFNLSAEYNDHPPIYVVAVPQGASGVALANAQANFHNTLRPVFGRVQGVKIGVDYAL